MYMNELIRIGEVAHDYQISKRTLRYYEDTGMLCSIRDDSNGYRYYDKANIKKLHYILLLRNLRISIEDIQKILCLQESSGIIDTFSCHLQAVCSEIADLKGIELIIGNFIDTLRKKVGISNTDYGYLLEQSCLVLEKTIKTKSSANIIEEVVRLKSKTTVKLTGVRIIQIPPMHIAHYSAISATPEKDAWTVIKQWYDDNDLKEKPNIRIFGVDGPKAPDREEYEYQIWVSISEDMEVQPPMQKKYCHGGLYAAYPSYVYNLQEMWGHLNEWVRTSDKYELDWDNPYRFHPGLEEILNMSTNIDDTDFQMDLLCPISIKTDTPGVVYNFEPVLADMGEIKIVGIDFHQQVSIKSVKDKSVNYRKLGDTFRKIPIEKWPICPERSTTYTYCRPAPETACNSPIFEFPDGTSDAYIYCAAVETTSEPAEYHEGLEFYTIPPSKYVVFSCEFANEEMARGKHVNVKPLFDVGFKRFIDNNCNGFKIKNYCLEKSYRKDGKFMNRYELMIPVE
jgi:DNA-binding transcriptional MerR regulator/DNA gyrase inhibitor GyrI